MKIVGIRFRQTGKMYDFALGDLQVAVGDKLIVETARGPELGEVGAEPRNAEPGTEQNYKQVLRRATAEDLAIVEANRKKERSAMETFRKKIEEHKLEMEPVEVNYAYDGSKILFYFTAEGRVDFRDLVKDLAGIFRTRIELRQIGVRDEAKMMGGLGICGRPFCCASYLNDFQPVSIKMAKEQGVSLNPVKISGNCGRLMCCLKYEQAAYEDLNRNTPMNDAIVETPDGKGTVTEAMVLRRKIRVRLDDPAEQNEKIYSVDDVKVLKRGRGGAKPQGQDAPEAPEK